MKKKNVLCLLLTALLLCTVSAAYAGEDTACEHHYILADRLLPEHEKATGANSGSFYSAVCSGCGDMILIHLNVNPPEVEKRMPEDCLHMFVKQMDTAASVFHPTGEPSLLHVHEEQTECICKWCDTRVVICDVRFVSDHYFVKMEEQSHHIDGTNQHLYAYRCDQCEYVGQSTLFCVDCP